MTNDAGHAATKLHPIVVKHGVLIGCGAFSFLWLIRPRRVERAMYELSRSDDWRRESRVRCSRVHIGPAKRCAVLIDAAPRPPWWTVSICSISQRLNTAQRQDRPLLQVKDTITSGL